MALLKACSVNQVLDLNMVNIEICLMNEYAIEMRKLLDQWNDVYAPRKKFAFLLHSCIRTRN
jgi:hypothetical protein